MSHKNKKYGHARIQHEDVESTPTPTTVDSRDTSSTLNSLTNTVTSNLGLIATIGAGCAAAAFFIATDTGRTIFSRTRNFLVDSGSDAYDYVRGRLPNFLGRGEDLRELDEFDEKIHQLQEHFKSPAA